jgi:hypothetical protein
MPTLVAPGPQLDHWPPQADALIAQARARRRRRWLVGVLSVVVVTASLATWLARGANGRPTSYATAPGAQLTAATSCASAISYGPLPVWARDGFHPADRPMAYVLGAHGDIVAVLFGGRQHPLYSPPKPDRGNKVLWVSRLPLADFGNLEIAARRLVGGTEVGPVVRRTVAGGPGPSGIDMPQAGCWHFSLRWSGHEDSVDLAYTAS